MSLSVTKTESERLPVNSVPSSDPMLQEAEKLLEFDRVREMLAEEARFYMSREIVRESRPARHPEDVARLQDETAEAVTLLKSKGDIGLAGMRDPRDPLRRAMLGGMLNGSELLMLCSVFQSMWVARSTVMMVADDAPLLSAMASQIHDLRDVRTGIVESLSDSGDVLDSATPRLGQMRERSRSAYQRAMRIMERFASRDDMKPYLQSNAVASRGDRLVLEVKSSHRGLVRGIIHDVSASGQTAFIEPFPVIDAANEWREAAFEAEKEEERILRKLSRSIGVHGEIALASMQTAANLDAAVARGRLSLKIGGVRPVSSSESASDGLPGLVLIEARHPLLGDDAVPISMHLDEKRRGLVITGPNTGGKTIALKTLGLMALMHQSGLQISAREATALPVFDGVYADIGDAQSIDRSVSTFSSHMERVIKVIARASDRSLVLLDELGTGTDPEEGSALARAILDRLVGDGVWTCVTTHHKQVSEYAANHDHLANASVELDPETMLPNYRLIMGLPGQSYAMQVAKRLGLEQPIIDHAETMLDPLRSQTESLLKILQRERDQVREVQEQAAADRAEAERMRSEAEANLSQAERDRDKSVEETRDQLKGEAQRVRRQLRRLMREAERQETWQEARQSAADVARTVGSDDWMGRSGRKNGKLKESIQDDAPIFKVGDTVRVESLGLTGEIVELDRGNRAVILSGTMRFQARPHMMTLVKSASAAFESRSTPDRRSVAPRISHLSDAAGDLDVRGSRVYVVESMIPQFIDKAFMQGLTSVRIIHGVGSGALRQAVRDILSREPHVDTFHPAPQNAGGNGVTIAMLE